MSAPYQSQKPLVQGPNGHSLNQSSSASTSQRPHQHPSSRIPIHKRDHSGLSKDEIRPWGSRSVEVYKKVKQVGEGTYGKVYMGEDRETGEIVALKRVRMDNEREGFPITAIREIKILKKLEQHENIIHLKEIVTSRDPKKGIYMVFEYMEHDLTGLMLNPGSQRFDPTLPQIKCYMKQLLEGIHFCHSEHILHRDIKGSNLLLSNKGDLKIADFGLARTFSTQNQAKYTNRVITLWYRPPELLLGDVKYGVAVDMWSVGCILAEFLVGEPLIQGKTETDQLDRIWSICGTPTEETWPGHKNLPLYKDLAPKHDRPRNLRQYMDSHTRIRDEGAFNLLDRLLCLNPEKRIQASDALSHDWFWDHPLPCRKEELPSFHIASHEFEAKEMKRNYSGNNNRPRGPNDPNRPPYYSNNMNNRGGMSQRGAPNNNMRQPYQGKPAYNGNQPHHGPPRGQGGPNYSNQNQNRNGSNYNGPQGPPRDHNTSYPPYRKEGQQYPPHHQPPRDQSGHSSSHQSGHPSSHQSGHPSSHQSGHPSSHQGSYPPRDQSGHSSSHQSGYPSSHQSGHPSSHHSSHPSSHQSGHPSSHQGGHPASHHSSSHQGGHHSSHQQPRDSRDQVSGHRDPNFTRNDQRSSQSGLYARPPHSQGGHPNQPPPPRDQPPMSSTHHQGQPPPSHHQNQPPPPRDSRDQRRDSRPPPPVRL